MKKQIYIIYLDNEEIYESDIVEVLIGPPGLYFDILMAEYKVAGNDTQDVFGFIEWLIANKKMECCKFDTCFISNKEQYYLNQKIIRDRLHVEKNA